MLAEVMVTIGADEQGVPVPAKIVIVRDRRSKKWLALLSTDTTLTAEEIIALYGRRWDIETSFKMAKSFLNLAKEFQSRSFDAWSPIQRWAAADISYRNGPDEPPTILELSGPCSMPSATNYDSIPSKLCNISQLSTDRQLRKLRY